MTIDRENALKRLRELCPPGTTVFTILRHASRSGMSRRISAAILWKDPETGEVRPWELDGLIEALGTYKRRQVTRHGSSGSWKSYEEGLVIGGCGMNMGFHLVYSLSNTLYPDGFGIPMQPPSPAKGADPVTPKTQREAEDLFAHGWRAEHGRNGDRSGWDSSGGYALNHRWM